MAHKVKVGRLLLVAHGAYSSYERIGWFVAVQGFTPDDQLAEYVAETKADPKDYARFDYSEFLAWLLRKGLMVEVEEFFDEWHLGDYGKADEVKFIPRRADSAPAEQK